MERRDKVEKRERKTDKGKDRDRHRQTEKRKKIREIEETDTERKRTTEKEREEAHSHRERGTLVGSPAETERAEIHPEGLLAVTEPRYELTTQDQLPTHTHSPPR